MFHDRKFLKTVLLSTTSFSPYMRGVVDGLNTSEGKRRLRGELSITPLLAGLLAACGGGSTKYIGGPGTGTGPGGPGGPGPGGGQFDPLPFDVYVNDGVIEGATVWIDENGNGEIDEGDTRLGTTDENGRVANVAGEHAGKRIIVDLTGAVDLFTGKVFTEGLYTARSGERGGSDVVVSPVTTILEALQALDANDDVDLAVLLQRIFGTDINVELDDLHNIDNFILPVRAQGQTFAADTPAALSELIATTSIRLQALIDQEETLADVAGLVNDGFDPLSDLEEAGRTNADRLIAEARERSTGEPFANPNPAGVMIRTNEDTEFTFPDGVWGFRDPAGNTPTAPESSFVNLVIVRINLPADFSAVTSGGTFTDADGTTYQVGDTIPADKIAGLKYTPPANVFGDIGIVYRVSDGERQSDEATLIVTVVSVNDLPTDIVLSGDRDGNDESDLYVLNNGRITTVNNMLAGLLTAADFETNEDDATGAQTGLTYALSGAHGNLFQVVVEDGVASLRLRADATALAAGQIYTVIITVTDSDGGSYSETFSIIQGGLYVRPQGATQMDGTERVYSDSPTGLIDENADGSETPIQVGTVGFEGLQAGAGASGVKNIRYSFVDGAGDDDNGDFTLNLETGALAYTGSDSGDREAGAPDNHQPDDLNIRVQTSYYEVTQHAADFTGERQVDATGDRTDADTREFAYTGGTISQPAPHATVANANIRIVAKAVGASGNNIDIKLVYDAEREGADGTGTDALGVEVRGAGTEESPHIITIYTTAAGITTTAIKAAIEAHTQAATDDTAAANDLVFVNTLGTTTASFANANIRIVADTVGSAGNNIQVRLEYDIGWQGADGDSTDAIGIRVTGAGTSATPYIITIYTTAMGITTTAIKTAIDEHVTAVDGVDTALASELVSVTLLGAAATLDPEGEASNRLIWSLSGAPAESDPEAQTADAETGEQAITWELAGATPAPYHVAAGTIYAGSEAYSFAEAHVSYIAGSEQTYIIVAQGDHDDDAETPDTWHVQAVSALPTGANFYVLGTISSTDDSGAATAPIRIAGGEITVVTNNAFGSRTNDIVNGEGLDYMWRAKTAGAANAVSFDIRFDSTLSGAESPDLGVVRITVTGAGMRYSDPYKITIYTTRAGATVEQIKAAVEGHTEAVAGTDVAAANDIVFVYVIPGRETRYYNPAATGDIIDFLLFGQFRTQFNRDAYQVGAGTIFDGDEVIHFEGAGLRVDHAAIGSGDGSSSNFQNIIIVREGDHDSDSATPDRWYVDLITPTELAALVAANTRHYILAQAPYNINEDRPSGVGGFVRPYHEIENTDIDIGIEQNLGATDLPAYRRNADASGNSGDADTRTFSYIGGTITQTDSATADEVNVQVEAGTLHLANGVVINFDALASTTVTEHSYVIVDDVDNDNRYETRIVTDLPEGDDFYVLGTVANDGVRLIGGAVKINLNYVAGRTLLESPDSNNVVIVFTSKTYGALRDGGRANGVGDNIEYRFIYDSSIDGATVETTGVVDVRVSGNGLGYGTRYQVDIYTTAGGATAQQIKEAIEAHTAIVTRQSPGVSDTAAANDLLHVFVVEGREDVIYDPEAETSNRLTYDTLVPQSTAAAGDVYRVEAGTIYDGGNRYSFAARDFHPEMWGARIIIVRLGDHDSDGTTPETWQAEAVAELPASGRYYVLSNPDNEAPIIFRSATDLGSRARSVLQKPEILPGGQNVNIDALGIAPLSHSRFVSEEQEFVVNLNNLNDNMPVFSSVVDPDNPVQVTENQDREEVGVIFTAQASDLDDAGGESSIRYSLTAADNHGNTVTGVFEIDEMTGEIRLVEGQTLDNEAMVAQGMVESYTLTITATSSLTVAGTEETQTATQTLTVTVANVNEAPTQISLDRTAFDPTETRTDGGLLVSALTTRDVDTMAHSYVIAGTDAALFELRNGNELWFIGTANDLRGPGGTYQISITTTETGQDPALTYSQDFTISQGAVFLTTGRQVMDDAGRAVLVLGQVDNDGNFVRDATGQVRLVTATDDDSDATNNPMPRFVIGDNGRLVLHLVGDETADQVLAGTGLSVNDDNELMNADGSFVAASRTLRVFENYRAYTQSEAFTAEEAPSGTARFDTLVAVTQDGVMQSITDFTQWRPTVNRDSDYGSYAADPVALASRSVTFDTARTSTTLMNSDIGVYLGQLRDSFGSNHFELAADTDELDNEYFTIIADGAGNYHLYFTGRDGSGTGRDIGDFEMNDDLNVRIIGKTFLTAQGFRGIENAPVDGTLGGDGGDVLFHYTTTVTTAFFEGDVEFSAGTLYVNGRDEPFSHEAASLTGLSTGDYVFVQFGDGDGDPTTDDVWYITSAATLPDTGEFYVLGRVGAGALGVDTYFVNGQRTIRDFTGWTNAPADGSSSISAATGAYSVTWERRPQTDGGGRTVMVSRGTIYVDGQDEPIEINTHLMEGQYRTYANIADDAWLVAVFGDHDSNPTTPNIWYTTIVGDLDSLTDTYYAIGTLVSLDWQWQGDLVGFYDSFTNLPDTSGNAIWETPRQVEAGEVRWTPSDGAPNTYTHDYTLNLYNINDNAPVFATLSTVAEAAVQGRVDAPIYTLVSDANTATLTTETFDFASGFVRVTFPTTPTANVAISVAAGGKLYTADGEFDIPATNFAVAPSGQDELDETADAEFSLFQLSGGLLVALVADDGTVTLHLIQGGTGTIAERLAGHQAWLQGLATPQDRLAGKAYVLFEFPDVLEAADRTTLADSELDLMQLNTIDAEVRTDLMAAAPTYFTQTGTAGEVDPVVYFVATNENVDGGPDADALFTASATDADNVDGETPTETIRYVIKEGVGDSGRFIIDQATGEVRFAANADADYEIANGQTGATYRTYDLTVQAVSVSTLAEAGGERIEAQRVDASHDATDTDAREFVYWGGDVTYLSEFASADVARGNSRFTFTAKAAGSAGNHIQLVLAYDANLPGADQTGAGAPVAMQVRGAGTADNPYIITLFVRDGGILPSQIKTAIEGHATAAMDDTAAANDLIAITNEVDAGPTDPTIQPDTTGENRFTHTLNAVVDARVTAGTIYLEDAQTLISFEAANIPVLRAGQYLIADDPDGDEVYTLRSVSELPTTVTYYVLGKINAEGTALETRTAETVYLHSTEQEYEIRITDQPDAPTAIGLTRTALIAGSRVVGDFTVIDQDALTLTGTTRPAETGFTYTLVSGAGDTDNSLFEVYTNNGAPALRFATAAGTNRGSGNRKDDIGDTYSIRVRVTDSQSNTHEQVLTITEGSIFVYVDADRDLQFDAGEVRYYSNFQDARGNGLLAENLVGIQPNDDSSEATTWNAGVFLGRVGDANPSSYFGLAAASDNNNNDEFRLEAGALLFYRGAAGENSGNFEAGNTKIVEITRSGQSGSEFYIVRLADVNEGPVLEAGDTPIRMTESTTDEVQHIVLTTDMISITEQDPSDNDENGEPFGTVRLVVSGEQNGRIQVLNPDGEYRPASSFTLQQLRDGEVRFVHDGGEQFEVVNGFKDADTARPTQFVLTGNDGQASGAPTTFTVQVLNSPTAPVPTGSGLVYVNDPPTFTTPTNIAGAVRGVPTVDHIQWITMTFGGASATPTTERGVEFTFILPDGFSSGDEFWANIMVSGANIIKGVKIRIDEDPAGGLRFTATNAKYIVGSSFTAETVNFDTTGTDTFVATSDGETGYGFRDIKINGVALTGGGFIPRMVPQRGSLSAVTDDPSYIAFTEEIYLSINILEGRPNTLTREVISAADNDNTPAEVTFTLTAITTNGVLQKWTDADDDDTQDDEEWSALAVGDTFTQEDINNEGLRYVHNGDEEATSDSFAFTIADSDGGRIDDPITITLGIGNVNDTPVITGDNIVNMLEGTGNAATDIGYVLTAADIGVRDDDDAASDVIYTYTVALGSGYTLQKRTSGTWNDLAVNGTFTLQDVQDQNVRILHNGVQSGDSAIAGTTFTYSVDDDEPTGVGNGDAVTGTVTVNIDTVNDAPVFTPSNTRIAPDVVEGANTEIYFSTTDEEDTDVTSAATDTEDFTYELVRGPSETTDPTNPEYARYADNAFFELDGNQLKFKSLADLDDLGLSLKPEGEQYVIYVKVTDTEIGTESYQQARSVGREFILGVRFFDIDWSALAGIQSEGAIAVTGGTTAVQSATFRILPEDWSSGDGGTFTATGTPTSDGFGRFDTPAITGTSDPNDFQVRYTPTATNTAIRALTAGQTLEVAYTIDTSYTPPPAVGGDTLRATTRFTVTFTGVNDAPIVAVDVADSDYNLPEEPTIGGQAQTRSITGTWSFTDIDAGDAIGNLRIGIGSAATAAATDLDFAVPTSSQSFEGTFGTLTVFAGTDASRSWTYVLDETKVQSADLGQNVETFRFEVTDRTGGTGGTSTAVTLSITIQGENDIPVLTLPIPADLAVTEDAPDLADRTVSGSGWTVSDRDKAASLRLEINNLFAGTITTENNPDGVGKILDTDSSNTIRPFSAATYSYRGRYGELVVNHDGTWTYTLTTRADAIAIEETPTEVLNFVVRDEHNAVSATHTVAITVTGVNDAPTDMTIGYTETDEANQKIIESGYRTDTEADFAVSTGSVTNVVPPNRDDIDANDRATRTTETRQEQTGTDAANDVAGRSTLTGTLDAVDADRIASTGRPTAIDLHVFEILGTTQNANDRSSTRDTTNVIRVDGNGVAPDPAADNPPETGTWSTEITGTYGHLIVNRYTGAWTYTLDNTDPQTIAIDGGDTEYDRFRILVRDENGASIVRVLSIRIDGTNDAPVAALDSTVTFDLEVTESGVDASNAAVAGDAAASGAFTATDDDGGDVAFGNGITPRFTIGSTTVEGTGATTADGTAAELAGTYGTFYLSQTGAWRYELDQTDEDTQRLDASDVVTETVIFTAWDGSDASQEITVNIQITGTNDAPVISTNSGAAYSVNRDEDDTGAIATIDVVDIDASDPDADDTTLTYVLSGTDAGRFTIGENDGIVRWVAAPDHENPTDSGSNNVYEFTVTVRDGNGGEDSIDVTINVQDLNDEKPTFNSGTSARANENIAAATSATAKGTGIAVYTADVTPDVDDSTSTVSYSLMGTDATSFWISDAAATIGEVWFRASPDHETKSTYSFIVRATVARTENGAEVEQFQDRTVTLTINDLNDVNPSFANDATHSFSVGENVVSSMSAPIYTATATPDVSTLASDITANTGVTASSITYAIDSDGTLASNVDRADFNIDRDTGRIWFAATPDHENAADSNSDNVYRIRVVVTATTTEVGNPNPVERTAMQDITITVNDLHDHDPVWNRQTAPTFMVDENVAVGTSGFNFVTAGVLWARIDKGTLSYHIKTGAGAGDGASFIVSQDASGNVQLRFASGVTPDADGTKTSYTFTLIARSTVTGETPLQRNTEIVVNVELNDLNDVAPSFTNGAAHSLNVGEDQEVGSANSFYTATATPDVGTVAYSKSTVAGAANADAASFGINTGTGAIYFVSGTTLDADGASPKTQYRVTVVATVGTLTATQQITVNIDNVNDVAPSFANGAAHPVTVAENTATTTDIYTATATADVGTVVYSISTDATDADNVDRADFTINSGTGALRFAAVPNHESAADSNTDNIYKVTVVATVGTLMAEQVVTITVSDVEETAPTLAERSTTYTKATLNSGTEVAATTVVFDADATPDISGATVTYGLMGTDASLFTINSDGEVTFLEATTPDQDTKASYTFTITAYAGSTARTATLPVTLTVEAPLNQAPTGTSRTVTLYSGSNSGHYIFDVNDFGYADADGDALVHIEITQLETAGALKLGSDTNHDGSTTYSDVTENQDITLADIPKLRFEHGLVTFAASTGFADFDFRVYDGTAYSATPANTITIDLVAGNAPAPTITTTDTNHVVAGTTAEDNIETLTGTIIATLGTANALPDDAFTRTTYVLKTGQATALNAIGSFTINDDGEWEYTLKATNAQLNAALQAAATSAKTDTDSDNVLDAGDSFEVVYRVYVSGKGTTRALPDVTITVQGRDNIDGTTGDDATLGGTTPATVRQTINGGAGNDTITAGTAGDVIIGGYGADSITLVDGGATSDTDSDTVVYRIKSDHSSGVQALDGGDTITGFTRGTDKLILVDTATTATTLSSMFTSLGANNFLFYNPQASTPIAGVDLTDGLSDAEVGLGARYGIQIGFAVQGTVDGADGSALAGLSMRVVFDADGTKFIRDNASLFNNQGQVANLDNLQMIFGGVDYIQLFDDTVLPSDFF